MFVTKSITVATIVTRQQTIVHSIGVGRPSSRVAMVDVSLWPNVVTEMTSVATTATNTAVCIRHAMAKPSSNAEISAAYRLPSAVMATLTATTMATAPTRQPVRQSHAMAHATSSVQTSIGVSCEIGSVVINWSISSFRHHIYF
jgi:hypothetical protein